MGDIGDCFDTESSTDEEINLPVLQDKTPVPTEGTKLSEEKPAEVSDLAEKKWEVLSEDQWSEFNDEEAVFDFITTAIRGSILNRPETKVEPKTEVELLMQI